MFRSRKAAAAAVSISIGAAAATTVHADDAAATCHSDQCVKRVEKIQLAHRLHWRRHHPWQYARHHLPLWGVAMLNRLGPGCETAGKGEAGYTLRHDDSGGPHHGRYQYLYSTWLRTIPYLPRHLRAVATRRPAYDAVPAEQDVRTFYFYPSHRGEWQCAA